MPSTPSPETAARPMIPMGPLPQTVEQVRATGTGDVQVFSMTYLRDETEPVGELILIVDEGLEL